MGQLTYILRRLLILIPTALLVAMFAFFLMHLVPGSPAAVMLGDEASAETIRQLEKEMGLDKPLHIQFQRWFFGVLRGNLGESIFLDEPVTKLVMRAAVPSFLVATLGTLISLSIGLSTGVIAAVKKDSLIDQISLTSALLGASIPSFWLGLNLILLFAVILRLLPTSGYRSLLGPGNIANLKYLILPAIAVGFPNSALITRLTRSAMLDELGKEFITTARAKGARESVVIIKHALKNAAIPVVTVVGITMMNIMSKAVVTENVFRIPGLGRLIVSSITRRDYPTIQGILLVVAGLYILVNLLTDITYSFLDPRIRYD